MTEQTNKNPRRKSKKLLIAGLILLVIAAGFAAYWFLVRDTKEPEPSPVEPAVIEINKDQAEEAAQTSMTAASLVAISKDKAVVSINGQQQELTINSKTQYQKGADFVDGSFDDLSPGMQVEVIYGKKTGELYALWYQ